MKKVFDEGGVDYTISVADHGLVEIVSATLVISVYDLDLIPHVRDYGRRGTKWTSFSETMRISAGDHEIAYLDDGFAVDHGVTETNNVAATYEITLGDEALKALAEAGDELHIEFDASYVDYKGRARMMMMNSPEQIAILFLAEGH